MSDPDGDPVVASWTCGDHEFTGVELETNVLTEGAPTCLQCLGCICVLSLYWMRDPRLLFLVSDSKVTDYFLGVCHLSL